MTDSITFNNLAARARGLDWQGQSLGNDLTDISPDFVRNETDARIMRRIIRLAETPHAIKAFARECHKLSDYGYWFTLGTLWVRYTGWSDLQQWKWLFSSKRPNRATSLMKPSELRVFDMLPPELDVLRVHREGEEDWISYTIDLDAAKRFAAKRDVNIIRVYRINKSDAIGLFTRRCEAELLVLDRRKATPVTKLRVMRPSDPLPASLLGGEVADGR